MEYYLRETTEGREVFRIEPEIIIALDEENGMKIDVISDKPEKPQIESEEDQPLVLVQPPTFPCTIGTPYKGVIVRELSLIFYTADTFVLDDPNETDCFMLEVSNELLNLKEGAHANYLIKPMLPGNSCHLAHAKRLYQAHASRPLLPASSSRQLSLSFNQESYPILLYVTSPYPDSISRQTTG
ncbi:hypothetical protein Scep_017091 [Stephania cephalantha]|uniref:Uncharacterized protein n=1 Tax=Stephania cephalantha TaxID=152367 RepID=A0AAP0IQ90_9MAGN